jgi:hypothetical protein
VTTVSKKHRRAMKGLEESNIYLRELSENLDLPNQEKWDEQMLNAQMNRTTDIEAMDVFDVAFEKGILIIPFVMEFVEMISLT